jgi:Ca-activated chloride channel family protein
MLLDRFLPLASGVFRLFSFCSAVSFVLVQLALIQSGYAQSPLPYLDNAHASAFAQLDFAELYANEEVWQASTGVSGRIKAQGLTDSGTVSALDIAAPRKAVREFNHGINFLKTQQSKEAIECLRKAVSLYPNFFSAHSALGLAYSDRKENDLARQEFATAAQLDDSSPEPFVNLGILDLAANDFARAESNFQKAVSLNQNDARILTALAFAENGNHRYAESLRTSERAHAMKHLGMANIHYIAAAAAMSLNDRQRARRELDTLVKEDPANPLAPLARQRLDELAASAPPSKSSQLQFAMTQTFPDSAYLENQLKEVAREPDSSTGSSYESVPEPLASEQGHSRFAASLVSWDKLFTIHQPVDETALFFSVSHRGHSVNDLSISDIQIHDDNKAPEKILQFVPQSKLPLRLGLLIDTSESVSHRFQFEKRAAETFVTKVLNSSMDLAFVAGFNQKVLVTQDFTRDAASLSHGIDILQKGGETSLFDAVYSACWKLAAYPDQGRVARVLVVLTDGEDNSSRRTLHQAIEQAEAAGVTIYTLSTSETSFSDSDADNVLRVLAERSGGESMFPGNLGALDKYLTKLPDVIRTRYFVAYRPAAFRPDGKYRTIQVTASKDGKRFKVHVRKGYYARLAPIGPDLAQR